MPSTFATLLQPTWPYEGFMHKTTQGQAGMGLARAPTDCHSLRQQGTTWNKEQGIPTALCSWEIISKRLQSALLIPWNNCHILERNPLKSVYWDRDIPVPLTAILCLLHRLWNTATKTTEGKINPKLMLMDDLNKQNNHSLFQRYKWAKHFHRILQTTAGVTRKRHQAAKSTSKESKKWLNRTKSALTITF